jgi:beta-galactosidase
VPRVPVVFKDVFRYVDVRNKNKKGYGKIDQEFVAASLVKAEGIIGNKIVAEHQRWPVGRKRRLILKVDDSAIQPIADGSDITPVVAYLVDAGGAIKRLSHEYIRFSVSGEGELIGGTENVINPQKLLWGEAVALVRSGLNPGTITVRAETIKDGTNMPVSAEIDFTTVARNQTLLYHEMPELKGTPTKGTNFTNEKKTLLNLQKELRKTQQKLQEYRLNEVGRQQEDFIQ